MDFNTAEPTCYRTNFPYASSGLQIAAFSYIILSLTYIRGLILELDRDFPIAHFSTKYVIFIDIKIQTDGAIYFLRTTSNAIMF